MNSIDNIDTKELFEQMKQFSKDHYIDTQEKYDKLFKDYYAKSLQELLNEFNSFETFSFDNQDYSDEAIILIQILSLQKKDNLKVLLRKVICDSCQEKVIAKYREDKDSFLCDFCTRKREGENFCVICKSFPKGNDIIFNDFCCQKYYCRKCLIQRINSEFKLNKGSICCYCGEVINQFLLESLVGDSSFKKNYKKFYPDN